MRHLADLKDRRVLPDALLRVVYFDQLRRERVNIGRNSDSRILAAGPRLTCAVKATKGQALLELEVGDFRDRLEEAEARYRLEPETVQLERELLALAKRNRVLQEAEVERLTKLQAKSLTSGSQLDTARQTHIQLRAEEARLEHARRTAPQRLALKRTQRDQAARQLKRATLLKI